MENEWKSLTVPVEFRDAEHDDIVHVQVSGEYRIDQDEYQIRNLTMRTERVVDEDLCWQSASWAHDAFCDAIRALDVEAA